MPVTACLRCSNDLTALSPFTFPLHLLIYLPHRPRWSFSSANLTGEYSVTCHCLWNKAHTFLRLSGFVWSGLCLCLACPVGHRPQLCLILTPNTVSHLSSLNMPCSDFTCLPWNWVWHHSYMFPEHLVKSLLPSQPNGLSSLLQKLVTYFNFWKDYYNLRIRSANFCDF